MVSFLSWYILITLLGWLTFPLAYRLFPALTDRGYTLSRAFGLLIWGYIFWLFASFGIAQNDIGGLLLGLVVLAGLSAWAITNYQLLIANSPILSFLKSNRRLILTTELLFLLAFAFMAFIRAGNPEILGTEKPMELMMIHGIMNSPVFPPRDLWLSGYSISYYYFGYVMTSMLAMFTGTPATMAFNLMIALIFALSAVGAYGIVYNLLANYQSPITNSKETVSSLQSPFPPLLAPLFLLLISNAAGFLEVLHRRGLFWRDGNNFWTWLDLPELRDAPAQPLQWIPDRFWWWWRASRVVQDYELNGNWTGDVIDEFPAFSYVLGDLHPHVLAMPFVLLAIAMGLNIFLGGWRGKINFYFAQLHISKTGFVLGALMLGGLAFLNTWDLLTGVAVIVSSYVLARVREAGWGWERIEDVLLLAIPSLVTAYVMYIPFFIGFDSQAGGVVPNFMFITRGAHLWVMWGALFVPIFAYLIHLWRARTPANWRASLWATLLLLIVLLLAMFIIGFIALRFKPDLVNPIIAAQGLSISGFIIEGFARRFVYIGSLITLLALLIPTLSFLFADRRPQTADHNAAFRLPPSAFVLLLITLGALIILGPEFLYLRDNFGYRINTIFKFYYQAWILISIASAYGTAVLLYPKRNPTSDVESPRRSNIGFRVVFIFILLVGLTYPALAFANKTNNFTSPFGYTLNDFDRVQREDPDEAAAIQFLQSAPDGVVLEATGGAYSSYARISIYTGLPTVLGWDNHEGQWRDYALLGTRRQDIETLYTTPDWFTAQDIIARYEIRYIYIGNLERTTYPVNEDKFFNFLKLVFQQGNVTIYEAP
jgi:YYY domain-containing protein